MYRNLVEHGIVPMPGVIISNGRVLECALALLDWVEELRIKENSEPTGITFADAINQFSFKSTIAPPGRPATFGAVMKTIGVTKMQMVISILAGEGIIGPTDEQIVAKVRQLQLEGKLEPSHRKGKKERARKMAEIRNDSSVKKLDEETFRLKRKTEPMENHDGNDTSTT